MFFKTNPPSKFFLSCLLIIIKVFLLINFFISFEIFLIVPSSIKIFKFESAICLRAKPIPIFSILFFADLMPAVSDSTTGKF